MNKNVPTLFGEMTPAEHREPCSPERNDQELHYWFAECWSMVRMIQLFGRKEGAILRDIDRYARNYERRYATPYRPTAIRTPRFGRLTPREREFIRKCSEIRIKIILATKLLRNEVSVYAVAKALEMDEESVKDAPRKNRIKEFTNPEECARVLYREQKEIDDLYVEAQVFWLRRVGFRPCKT